nr:replication-associated recombination protein A [Chloroflexota bacterium]
AIYRAYDGAVEAVVATRNDPVPLHLRNAPTKLMQEAGYSKGYRYAHDFEDGIIGQQNVPENVAGRTYYVPTDRGFEAELTERLARIRAVYAATLATEEPAP